MENYLNLIVPDKQSSFGQTSLYNAKCQRREKRISRQASFNFLEQQGKVFL